MKHIHRLFIPIQALEYFLSLSISDVQYSENHIIYESTISIENIHKIVKLEKYIKKLPKSRKAP